jgi:hypothetical protein
MALSTIVKFKEVFTTDYTDSQISLAINTASSYIEQYIDRSLEQQEYIEVLDVHCGLSELSQYPIVKIKNVLNEYNDVILIKTDSIIYQATLYSNNTSIVITTTDNNAVDTETTLNYSSNANLASLTTSLDNISGITATIDSIYNNTPSKYLYPINTSIKSNGQYYLKSWTRVNGDALVYTIDPVTTRNLLLNSYIDNYIYVNYIAGYLEADMPLDIVDITNRLSYIILNDMSGGIISGYYKSESIGDYSYTLSDGAKSSIESLMYSFEDVLQKYKKIWLIA